MNLEAEFGNYITKEAIRLKDYAEKVYFPKYTAELSPTTKQHYRQLYKIEKGIQDKLGNVYSMEQVMLMLQRAEEINNINMQLLLALICQKGLEG